MASPFPGESSPAAIKPPVPETDRMFAAVADLRPRYGPIAPLIHVLRHGRRLVNAVVDRGWLGLTPLRTHVVICGFPRSGSTLLQLMVSTSVPGVRTFREEARAMDAALFQFRNHATLVTKRPNDVYWIDEIRAFHERHGVQPRFIVTYRDPRAILTSVHARQGHTGFYVGPERWRSIQAHFLHVREAADVITIDFADLVRNLDAVQERLEAFVGWRAGRRFADFHRETIGDFDTAALGGVRQLDPAAIDRWRSPRYRDRIISVLDELPELPRVLVELGYEPDERWIAAYR